MTTTGGRSRGQLAGRVAIVTGGGHGIGKAYCQGLAREEATVVVVDIDGQAAQRVAHGLQAAGARTLAITADVADENCTQALATSVIETLGRIDVLINNAAIFATIPISRVTTEEIPLDEWDLVLRVNLRGPFLMCRAVLPAMKAAGFGRIINISSGTVFEGVATRVHYVTTKAGIIGLTRTLSKEVGEYGITVNCLAPGSTLSEENPTPETLAMRQAHAANRAIRRVQTPDDLIGAVVFLASEAAGFITGQTLVVDGGAAMH